MPVRSNDLLERLDPQRFRPFRIHVRDGRSIDVRYRRALCVGISSFVWFDYPNQECRIHRGARMVGLSHVEGVEEIADRFPEDTPP
jgi:hypothetical protein